MADPRNPLEGFMEQAKRIQARMEQLQREVADARVEGGAGGGLVKVVATAGQEIVRVDIDPSVIDPEDPELLGDLVAAACNDALRKGREELQRRMRQATGGIDPARLINLFGGPGA
ncbi:MAG: YbaB/EbfC family nucleoid-associated protein [Nitrospirae bacterium]|nr:MAG: YbaB/EbfC family nucleoid-associated protein [Nitrospirota bacterium]